MESKFDAGNLVITTNAYWNLNLFDVRGAIFRHLAGDWGDVCPDDASLNDQALTHGDRLVSSYTDRHGKPFWIITEADRSYTTVLLPSDY